MPITCTQVSDESQLSQSAFETHDTSCLLADNNIDNDEQSQDESQLIQSGNDMLEDMSEEQCEHTSNRQHVDVDEALFGSDDECNNSSSSMLA